MGGDFCLVSLQTNFTITEAQEEGKYICIWLIHFVVWQKPIPHCKTIILQFKKMRL